MHRIVIVGGGAGGLELATRLGDTLGKAKRAHITLIDRCPTHIWKPLLHEVAAGSLDVATHQIAYAAQARWHHFAFVQGTLAGLTREKKLVTLAAATDDAVEGADVTPQRDIAYDTLVLALGSQTHFFGIPGAKAHAITLDTLEQAEKLRRRLLSASVRNRLSSASGTTNPVRVAIIGGGATGVELAAELRKMEEALRQFGLHPEGAENDIRITLLEAGPRLLPALSTAVSDRAARLLASLDIDVSVGDPVMAVGPSTVTTQAQTARDVDITIWAAGIKAPEVLATLDGLAVNRINQIAVTETLQSKTDPDIFALGDCASCVWSGDKMVPPRAQAAHQQAVYLSRRLSAKVLGKRGPASFAYVDHGSLVSIGALSAVGSITGRVFKGSIHIEGLLARTMYAALYWKHLAGLLGMRKMLLGQTFHLFRKALAPTVRLY